jgi:transcriptional regulator with XRE-family HTH domain
MIGTRLRDARLSRSLSLTELANKAHISAATLSRIENEKQGLDLAFFLLLARLLKVPPADLLGIRPEEEQQPLVDQISALSSADRTHLWRELAKTARNERTSRRNGQSAVLSQDVDELLAQVEFMREEIEAVRRKIAHR